ncbi:MAG: hypothetical protein PHR35_08920 [Kiritimatiellae bacterium]|nr:hypothetical protein [Kiritimatiellia bacterium]
MSFGFDASGRAFRWLSEAVGTPTAKPNVLYVPQGVPPLDADEQPLWQPFAATAQIPLRSQISERTLSIELAWTRLLRGDHPLTWTYADGRRGKIAASRALAQSVASCLDGPDRQGVAIAAPNLMDEDAQDALLAELAIAGFGNCYLIWRPVALALNWLHQPGQAPRQHRGALWIVDFESAGIEVTRLDTRSHARDPQWLCPVRSYPSRTWDNRSTLRPSPPCDPLFAIWNAWLQGFVPQPNRITRQSLAIGPAAPSLQRAVEEDQATRITVPAMSGLRVVRYAGERTPPDANVWSLLRSTLPTITPRDRTPVAGEIILLHGWVPRLWPEAAQRAIQQVWPGVITHVPDHTAVASGAALYAQRRARNLPTYYDAVPEYGVWAKVSGAPPGFCTVIPATNTEPEEVITLKDEAIRNAFAIDAHREALSVIVQRHPVLNAKEDFAHRIRANLKRMASHRIALRLDASIQAAHGNARFTFTLANGERLFEGDLSAVTLSYSRRTGAEAETEHKGYIEAQPVIGRVHDSVANVDLLRKLVDWLEGGTGEGLADAIEAYRTDGKGVGVSAMIATGKRTAVLELGLDRWGWGAKPRQDTRGFFGTRRIDDADVSQLADRLTRYLFATGPVPPGKGPAWFAHLNWHNHLNWCHAYAGRNYQEHIRSTVAGGTIFSWPQAFAPGYVLGETATDVAGLVRLASEHGFAYTASDWAKPESFVAKYWWSLFRLLCWHPETRIEPEQAEGYIKAICDRLDAAATTEADQRKNGLLALLFALRVRQTEPTALLPTDPICQRVCNAIIHHMPAVPYPPSMIAHLPGLAGNLSEFVLRFVQKQDTLADRELGASIATME